MGWPALIGRRRVAQKATQAPFPRVIRPHDWTLRLDLIPVKHQTFTNLPSTMFGRLSFWLLGRQRLARGRTRRPGPASCRTSSAAYTLTSGLVPVGQTTLVLDRLASSDEAFPKPTESNDLCSLGDDASFSPKICARLPQSTPGRPGAQLDRLLVTHLEFMTPTAVQ